jgi:hypothetical protein
MPYNVAPSSAPMLSSSGNWMSLAQIIAGLVGGDANPTPPPPTANQNAALSAGQGPLAASSANDWSANLTKTLMNPGVGGGAAPAQTPGYNPSQFGVPLGTQQSNSY